MNPEQVNCGDVDGGQGPPPVAVISTESPLVIGGLGQEGTNVSRSRRPASKLARLSEAGWLARARLDRLQGAGTHCPAPATLCLATPPRPFLSPWSGQPPHSPSADKAASRPGLPVQELPDVGHFHVPGFI